MVQRTVISQYSPPNPPPPTGEPNPLVCAGLLNPVFPVLNPPPNPNPAPVEEEPKPNPPDAG